MDDWSLSRSGTPQDRRDISHQGQLFIGVPTAASQSMTLQTLSHLSTYSCGKIPSCKRAWSLCLTRFHSWLQAISSIQSKTREQWLLSNQRDIAERTGICCILNHQPNQILMWSRHSINWLSQLLSVKKISQNRWRLSFKIMHQEAHRNKERH